MKIDSFDIFTHTTSAHWTEIRGQYVDFMIPCRLLDADVKIHNPHKAHIPSQYFLALKVRKELSNERMATDGVFQFSLNLHAKSRFAFWRPQGWKGAIGNSRGKKTILINKPVRAAVAERVSRGSLGLVYAFESWQRSNFGGVEFANEDVPGRATIERRR